MSLTPVRSYTRLAIAIVIAAVVISASILSYSSFEATITRTGTTNTTTATTTLTVVDISTFATTVTRTQAATCIEGTVDSNTYEAPGASNVVASATPSNSTDDCQLGVTLDVAADPAVSVGHNETIYVSLINDFAVPNNVNYTGLPSLPHGFVPDFGVAGDYTLPISDGCLWPSSTYEPAFIAIYNESGAPVQLNGSPPSITYCPALPNYHSFNASQAITETLSIGGSWTSSNSSKPWINATYSRFSPGNYTVVAFDPWGQLAQLNFSVVRFDTSTTTTGSTSSSTGLSISSATSASVSISGATTDQSLGLRLGLHISVNATGALAFETNESNLLDRVNNVTTAGDWPYPDTNSLPCGDWGHFPIQYAVLQGYYGMGNYTSASALTLYDPTVVVACPTVSAAIPYLLFSPLSDNASISSSTEQGNSYLVSADYSVTGYWTDSGTFHQFPRGVYTALVEDEWGDVVLLHFTEG